MAQTKENMNTHIEKNRAEDIAAEVIRLADGVGADEVAAVTELTELAASI